MKQIFLCFNLLLLPLLETKRILKNVNGSFKKGDLTAVLGPSGILTNFILTSYLYPKIFIVSWIIFIGFTIFVRVE